MGSIADAAAVLATVLQDALTDAGHGSAVATTDPDEAFTAAASGHGAILIGPPVIEYGTTLAGDRDALWPVTVAYQGTGAWDAWQHIDTLVSVVADTLDCDTARPAQLNPTSSDPIPAYIVTTQPFPL